jgi:hypothetical protein
MFKKAHASPSPEGVCFSNIFGLTDLRGASGINGRCSKTCALMWSSLSVVMSTNEHDMNSAEMPHGLTSFRILCIAIQDLQRL